ncbi:MAG: PhoH family protein [Deltaproteobacteria bacterium]|nr:PhoH family protein [Deltaproteobacteria bacterium]MDD9828548.1 PhoH family protein [Deltaproteobacteria bacterium]
MPQAEKLKEDAIAPAAAGAQELVFDDNALAAGLLGERDWVLRLLERELGIRARARGNRVLLRGAEARVQHGRRALEDLYGLLRGGRPLPLRSHDVRAALEVAARDDGTSLRDVYAEVLVAEGGRRRICTKNPAQRRYLELMRRNAVVLAIGPAGTGKTYLAMAMALAALDRGDVSRVILTRPAVEAGEKLGFLPGSMTEKVDPYLRPLYDALHDMMSMDRAQRMMERGAIEVAPLAFMRGRTLNGCFVILDEAQNTTPEQMKMFLTRLGYDAKAVVTGDVTQVDLPSGQQSGLADARRVLDGVPELGFMHFSEADVVRHPVVQSIIRAYELDARGRGA